jgi:hypothetical protein
MVHRFVDNVGLSGVSVRGKVAKIDAWDIG